MYLKSVFWGGVLFAIAMSAEAQLPSPTPTPGPTPALPYAVITYPSTDMNVPPTSVVTSCADGVFGLVGLQPDEVVQVIVHLPASEALQVVNLEALDGGQILPPAAAASPAVPSFGVIEPPWINPGPNPLGLQIMAIQEFVHNIAQGIVTPSDESSTLSFAFKAASDPGVNQISVRERGQEFGLRFWVADMDNPDVNPPAITPETPQPYDTSE